MEMICISREIAIYSVVLIIIAIIGLLGVLFKFHRLRGFVRLHDDKKKGNDKISKRLGDVCLYISLIMTIVIFLSAHMRWFIESFIFVQIYILFIGIMYSAYILEVKCRYRR